MGVEGGGVHREHRRRAALDLEGVGAHGAVDDEAVRGDGRRVGPCLAPHQNAGEILLECLHLALEQIERREVDGLAPAAPLHALVAHADDRRVVGVGLEAAHDVACRRGILQRRVDDLLALLETNTSKRIDFDIVGGDGSSFASLLLIRRRSSSGNSRIICFASIIFIRLLNRFFILG